MNIEIKIKPELVRIGGVPQRGTSGSAALDLKAVIDTPVTLRPQETYKFDTGIAIDIGDPGVAAYVLPRSGSGTKGLVLANTVGLIDSDYQGPISCFALNRNRRTIRSHAFFKKFLPSLYVEEQSITINPGDRIFQLVFMPVIQPNLVQVEQFSRETERGEGGYGSTGVK